MTDADRTAPGETPLDPAASPPGVDGGPPRVLRVELGTERATVERLPSDWARRYLGGKGLAARYLYRECPGGTDPLAPDAPLCFATGPLSGVLPGEPRSAVVAKSPLTGAFLDSYVGGSVSAALPDALGESLLLALHGRADRPVVVRVRDGDASVEPAGELWGAETPAVDEGIDGAVACVGPAGVHGARSATVAVDGGDHQAGRGGIGALLGAKRVLAVAVHGERPTAMAERRTRDRDAHADSDVGRWRAAGGTVETVDFAEAVGALPTPGWGRDGSDGALAGDESGEATGRVDAGRGDDPGERQSGRTPPGVEAVRAGASRRELSEAHDAPEIDRLPGDFVVETPSGSVLPRGSALLSLGALLDLHEFDDVIRLTGICDRLGVDVIEAGNAVAWAARASARGLVDRDVELGDVDAAATVIEELATRGTPLGDALADGVDAAAARYGGDDLVPTVKAMGLPGVDPRASPAQALAYATADRGGCHRRARPVEREPFEGTWEPEAAAAAVVAEQDRRAATWCLIADDFVGETLPEAGAGWLRELGRRSEAGWLADWTAEDVRAVGRRTWTLVRAFNCREGFDRDDDRLPAPLSADLDGERFRAARAAYYDLRGWDARGRPTAATLDRLDVDVPVEWPTDPGVDPVPDLDPEAVPEGPDR
jgi:aldehyde:ferredoxin oxidoreductase